MGSTTRNQYRPDYVSAPGETLLETIQALGISQAELAERTGRPKKTINQIIKGKAAITPATALQLERVLGVPASFWSNRERHYREAIARREEQERLEKHADWLREFPLRTMVKWGWIRQFKDRVQQVQELLNFFGVASPEQWQAIWKARQVAFRRSAAFRSDPAALAAWLRRGEVIGQHMDCAPYDGVEFKRTLSRVRGLTLRLPEEFVPRMLEACAECGVAVVLVPQLPRTRASGVTCWLTPRKALIELSLRYKSDDQFWFSFFHEAGHILLHGKREVFIDYGDSDGPKEQQANAFARDMLIPPSRFGVFVRSGRWSKLAISQFARQIGISPGIVVGRLQHEGKLDPSHCNDLKRRFQWATDESS